MSVLKQIDALLSGKCASCPMKAEMNSCNGRLFARFDGHCNRECPVGKQLQELGKVLGRGHNGLMTRPRMERRAMVLAE